MGGWFPRADTPPLEDHIGVLVQGDVKKDSDFFKGALTLEKADAAIADLNPGIIKMSDYPSGIEYRAVSDTDIQNMSGGQVNAFGDTVDGILDTLLEKNGLGQKCRGVLS